MIESRKKIKDIQLPQTIRPSFAISGKEILMIECTKYLGVQMDRYMSWENYITHVTKKSVKGPRHDTLFALSLFQTNPFLVDICAR